MASVLLTLAVPATASGTPACERTSLTPPRAPEATTVSMLVGWAERAAWQSSSYCSHAEDSFQWLAFAPNITGGAASAFAPGPRGSIASGSSFSRDLLLVHGGSPAALLEASWRPRSPGICDRTESPGGLLAAQLPMLPRCWEAARLHP